MRILIDIGHPAHVHYFKNLIWIMQKKGHEFRITARNKECAFDLLDSYKLPYISRGKGAKSLIGKMIYLLKADFLLFLQALKFKPDIFFSFGSTYAAHASKLYRKPHIAFDDTEIAKLEHLLYVPFTDAIFTPEVFRKDFGKKQCRFNGIMELSYLHPNYFTPDESVLDEVGISKGEVFTLLRLVSWNASHDVGQKGFSGEDKLKLVDELKNYGKVLISSEGAIPSELKEYQISLPAHRMHHLLSFASLYVGEGATMASECAALGTPAIYVNSLTPGYIKALEDDGLLFQLRNFKDVVAQAVKLLNDVDTKYTWQQLRQKMLSEKIDVTAFMVWVIERFPESVRILNDNPEYQNRFYDLSNKVTQKFDRFPEIV